jgi:flagellar basal body-associated protein FliL
MFMRLIVFVIALASLVVAPAATAAGGSSSKGKSEKSAEPLIPQLKMPRLVAPVMVKGEMVRYVHFEVKFILPDESNKKMLMDKVPYLQDAFLRDVHGATIVKNEDTQEVDEAGLKARLLAICARVVGNGLVKDIELRDVTKDAL